MTQVPAAAPTDRPDRPGLGLADPEFVRATAVQADLADPTRFSASFAPTWASLRGVHGGYQAAVAVRAASAVMPGRTVRTVTATFLRPGQVGPAVLDVEVLRSTRTFTTTAVTISQEGRSVADVRITAIERVAGNDWSTPVADRAAPISESVAFTPPPQIRHFEQAVLLVNTATIPNSDAEEARIGGHVRPNAGSLLDAAWLVMIGDWFPPSPFRRVQIPIGGVSIDYTVHLHRTAVLAAGEYLEGVFTTENSVGGIALEHGTLCTGDGIAVAETFHTRWTG